VGPRRARRVDGDWPRVLPSVPRPQGPCLVDHFQFPHHPFTPVPLDGRAGGQRLYRRSPPPLLFLSSNSVCLDICQHFPFYLFSLRIYFRPAPLLAGPIESLLCPSARHCRYLE
jgi:hypothetical protein